ncbi:hypothetical protein CKO15_05675 [Halorhodospira abdelmalekii]|nr:hypothetical protein [Halorhodospira abdelmalekii]
MYPFPLVLPLFPNYLSRLNSSFYCIRCYSIDVHSCVGTDLPNDIVRNLVLDHASDVFRSTNSLCGDLTYLGGKPARGQ